MGTSHDAGQLTSSDTRTGALHDDLSLVGVGVGVGDRGHGDGLVVVTVQQAADQQVGERLLELSGLTRGTSAVRRPARWGAGTGASLSCPFCDSFTRSPARRAASTAWASRTGKSATGCQRVTNRMRETNYEPGESLPNGRLND